MENDISMLQSVRKATQMGRYGIQSVINETCSRSLRGALRSQLSEYNQLFTEADTLLKERGAQRKNVNPMAKLGAFMNAKMKVRSSLDPTSAIAEMLVQGNTRGMIKSMNNIRTMGVLDPKVSCLSGSLLQTEQANIDQMKQYL